MTKLYALVALTVGALALGRAEAQSSSEGEWLGCMDVWADESICGPRPAPEQEPLPEPEPEPTPPPVTPPPATPPPATPPPATPPPATPPPASGPPRGNHHGWWRHHQVKAKAFWNHVSRWCSGFFSSRGRR